MFESKLREVLRAALVLVPLVACAQGAEPLPESVDPREMRPDAAYSSMNDDSADEDQDAAVEDATAKPDVHTVDTEDAADAQLDAAQGAPSEDAGRAEDADLARDTAAPSSADAAGEAGLGDASAPTSCPSCMLKVEWNTSTTSDPTPAIAGNLKLTNTGSVAVPLEAVTLRYWLRDPAAESMVLECYYWDDGSGTGTNKCTRPTDAAVNVFDHLKVRIGVGANDLRFIEVGFSASAGELSPGGAAPGAMQVSLHLPSFTPMSQNDDPSFDATLSSMSASMLFDAPKISAYLAGQLAWGSEP